MATTLRVPQTRWSARLTRECSSTESNHVYFTSTDTLGITEGWFDFDPTTSNAETFYLTGITGTPTEYTGTITYRGLRTYGVDTEVSNNKKSHRVSARVIISDDHNWIQQIITAFNTHEDLVSSFHGFAGIGTTASRPSAASNANKLYASTDDLVVYFSNGTTWNSISAGTQPDASTTVKGVSKLSVTPVSSTDPIVVGDNDPRMISAGNVTDLTDGGESSLHYHNSDRARSNHTGTQSISTILESGTAGETLTTDQLIYLKSSDGKIYKATQDVSSDANAYIVRGIVVTGGNTNDAITYRLLVGKVTLSTPLTANTTYYLGVSGALDAVRPSISLSTVRPVIIGRTDNSGSLICNVRVLPRNIVVSANGTGTKTLTVGFPISHAHVTAGLYDGTQVQTSTGYFDNISGVQATPTSGGLSTTYVISVGGTSANFSYVASVNGSNDLVLTYSTTAAPTNASVVAIVFEAL